MTLKPLNKLNILAAMMLLITIPIFAQIDCVMKIADEAEFRNINKMLHRKTVEKDFPDDEVIKIPVVVHVIHKGEEVGTGTNISDQQIISGIEHMSSRYRNQHGLSVDTGIEFCLAQTDPEGNPTTGINRFNGCISSLYCSEGITAGNGQGASQNMVKNWSRWPNQQYYNIWVVSEIENNNGGGGIQAYAYFPTTSYLDGTVLIYNTLGLEGNLKSYTDENETIIHELAHAFALFHTFHNTSSCNAETNCAIQGDRVCDTPPTPINSACYWPSCGGTQQVENYMDYTGETCKDLFTEGQADRMRLVIQNSRPNLMASGEAQCADPLPEVQISGFTDVQCNMRKGHATTTFKSIYDYNVDEYLIVVDYNYTGTPLSVDTSFHIQPQQPFDQEKIHTIILDPSIYVQALELYVLTEADTTLVDIKKFFCNIPVFTGELDCGWTLDAGKYYPAPNTDEFAVYRVSQGTNYELLMEGSAEEFSDGFTLPELMPGQYYFIKTSTIHGMECHFHTGIVGNK